MPTKHSTKFSAPSLQPPPDFLVQTPSEPAKPIVLAEFLTESILLEALKKLP